MNTPDSIVDIRNLNYAVGGRPIFTGLDMQFQRGKVTAVMGPSGTGKTTLLRLITGQVTATSGYIQVAGQDLKTLKRRGLYALFLTTATGALLSLGDKHEVLGRLDIQLLAGLVTNQLLVFSALAADALFWRTDDNLFDPGQVCG